MRLHEPDALRKEDEFLRRYLLSPVGQSTTSTDEIPLSQKQKIWSDSQLAFTRTSRVRFSRISFRAKTVKSLPGFGNTRIEKAD
jgi:hypothetical protein